MRNGLVGVLLAMLACSGDRANAPSCQQAVSHYYDAGCAFIDLDTGMQISVNESIANCKRAESAAPSSCRDELEDLRICLGKVPSPVKDTTDCDCSAEQDAILRCD